jgi:hypothetical protein
MTGDPEVIHLAEKRALRRSAALQGPRSKIRFDSGLLRNALRNVKGVLNYAVWGVPSGIVGERGEGNWP